MIIDDVLRAESSYDSQHRHLPVLVGADAGNRHAAEYVLCNLL